MDKSISGGDKVRTILMDSVFKITAVSVTFNLLKTLLGNAVMASIKIDRKTNKAVRSNHGINFCVSYESQIHRCYESRKLFFSRRFQRHLRGYMYKPKVPLNHGFRASNLACALSLTLRTVFRKEFQERSNLSVSALYKVIFLAEIFLSL